MLLILIHKYAKHKQVIYGLGKNMQHICISCFTLSCDLNYQPPPLLMQGRYIVIGDFMCYFLQLYIIQHQGMYFLLFENHFFFSFVSTGKVGNGSYIVDKQCHHPVLRIPNQSLRYKVLAASEIGFYLSCVLCRCRHWTMLFHFS